MKEEIETKFALKWSPEQKSGRSRKKGVSLMSQESICLYTYEDKKAGGIPFSHFM